jgi:hypothetical protein
MFRPLLIVMVGLFPTGISRFSYHSLVATLSNGFIRNGHRVLHFSDRDAALANAPFRARKLGRGAANAALLQLCRNAVPDVLLLGQADIITPSTVADIKSAVPGIRIGQWNNDGLFEEDNVRRILSKFSVVDLTFVTTGRKALTGIAGLDRDKVSFFPIPVDFSVQRGRSDLVEHPAFDLLYACGHPSRPPRNIFGRDWSMDQFMRELLKRTPNARPLLAGLLGQPQLHGAQYQSALESLAMGLNISRRSDHYLYTSDRIAQLAGNGVVVMIEHGTGYEDLFSPEEMVFFTSLDQLGEQINKLVAEPRLRMRIASQGRLRYHSRFNERVVAEFMLDVVTGRKAPDYFPWTSYN